MEFVGSPVEWNALLPIDSEVSLGHPAVALSMAIFAIGVSENCAL
jgi:hypothetical protein